MVNAMRSPMSPAAPRRTMPGQRNLLEAAPPPMAPPRKRGRTKNELAVLLTVIGLFVLAGGLALAIALQSNGSDDDKQKGTVAPPASASQDATDETEEPTAATPTTRPAGQPNGSTPKVTRSPSPSKSASASASASTSPTPTKTTTPPPTEPTTTTTPPATDPTTDPPENGGGGDGGGNAG